MSAEHFAVMVLSTLQTKSFYGAEKKTLAYIIGIMNMILHGIEATNYLHTNTLAESISDIQDKKSLVPGSRLNRFSSEPANMTRKYSKKRLSIENASVERFRG